MSVPWLGRRARARARIDRLPDGSSPGPAGLTGPRGTELVGAAVAVGLVALLVVDPALVAALVVVLPAAGLVQRRRAVSLARRRRREQLPEALERMAAALRSGLSLPQALAAAGTATPDPLGGELAALAREAERGRPVTEVLDGWVARYDDRGTRLAATALALAAGVGAAPARAIDGVAATVRERQQLAAERRALATQARTSAAALAVAPLGFSLLLAATDPTAARFLLWTPGGWACLAIGLALDGGGVLWMTRLVRSEDP